MLKHMTMDKLKGHTYNMSPYEYLEVNSHNDAELQWIVQETVDCFTKNITGDKFSIRELFEAVGEAVSKTIVNRLGSVCLIHPYRVGEFVMSHYNKFTGVKPQGQYKLAEYATIYAIQYSIIAIRFQETIK